MNEITIAQLQFPVSTDKEENLERLAEALPSVKAEGADLVCLGEMFNCPYDNACFPVYAEPEGGSFYTALSYLAKEYGIILSAGTIPECDAEGRIFNTAYVFSPEGELLAKHRKMHLFDIDVKGGQRFMESDTLTAGNDFTVFDTAFGTMGICICFDIRFPELSRMMALCGAKLILVPAAFNMTTGPAHWEISFRMRALDNQCFFAATSPARDLSTSYHAYGHSMITDPWGAVVHEMDEKEGIKVTTIDLDRTDEIRAQLPLLSARRPELYFL